MNRSICLHAHCYQPPRENPWLEAVEMQDSAYPYHNWNHRITAECYGPNTASRILAEDRNIIDIVNNYSRMSFNFGPTLLSWMEQQQPDTYQAIMLAHEVGKKHFGGHGPAIAQVYNHLIMPLANSRDKETQIRWGVRDFERRFADKPEGIWLAETAVDLETLDLCVDYDLKFTILAPRQAKRIRKLEDSADKEAWVDVNETIDPRRPYLCRLPSGRSIALFFYDGPIAQDLAFGSLLDDGRRFAERLLGAFDKEAEGPQLVHVATDGETYGHHHRFGDMALAWCLHHITENELARITIYSQYLEENPPEWEVEIHEDSSWSCVHGVERWRADCGCSSGMHGDWNQAWRPTLRGAMDWLRDSLALVFEERAGALLKDSWTARNEYIDVVLDRSEANVVQFCDRHARKKLSPEDRSIVLKLLEIQRQAMLMYTSCGWFFDELSGIETVQVMQYAARAMQLTRQVAGIDLEPAYIKVLERAPSNLERFKNGSEVYKAYVKPAVVDLARVGAHYAVSSLFNGAKGESTDVYCYWAEGEEFDRTESGRQRLASGRVRLKSKITLESTDLAFAVVHLGEQNLMGGVTDNMSAERFTQVQQEVKAAFLHSNIAEVIALIDKNMGSHSYSLSHLFREEQRKVMRQIIDDTLSDVELTYRQVYKRYHSVMQATADMQVPLPRVLSTTVAFVINTDLRKSLEEDPLDFEELQRLQAEVKRWNVEIDSTLIQFYASSRCNEMMEALEGNPENMQLMGRLVRLIEILTAINLDLDIWQAQNRHFRMGKTILPMKLKQKEEEDRNAARWIELFERLGELLRIRVR